ncbi:hypothetical protein CA13_04010 [Planctomycetes bacterium CA13]|uniref:Uncharacterized protein n=1 Tax=Novipirellula herctigrandis TaxID=2527986 RepID=A0A5C5YVF6_9BACT|nr:hypothetical protein CA13_04010 [Planctomycetes bacterium CA13]
MLQCNPLQYCKLALQLSFAILLAINLGSVTLYSVIRNAIRGLALYLLVLSVKQIA